MKLLNEEISNKSPVYFIADIAANHDGDLSRAKDLIWKAADAGANAAKFQHFQAASIVNDRAFKSLGTQLSHQKKWTKTVFEVYEEASVDLGWTVELAKTCEQAGIAFMTTPYNLEVVDHIDRYVPAYKIGSGDITWPELIRKVMSRNKPVMLATGASEFSDVRRAVSLMQTFHQEIVLMQCNTNYTAEPENFKYIKLRVLKTYRECFPDVVLGLSDHTPGCTTVLGAVALGAKVIEKHFTDDNNRSGPDHLFSMNPKSWENMVCMTRELELAMGFDGIKTTEDNERETAVVQRRGLYAKADIAPGTPLTKNHFEPLRPCPIDALTPWDLNEPSLLVSQRLIKKGAPLMKTDCQ